MENINSRVSNEHGGLFSPLLFNIILEFLAQAITQEEEIKEYKLKKK
jgi:hypothetical protein